MRKYFNSVTPEGKFVYGIHKPQYKVANFRDNKLITELGRTTEGNPVDNSANYPDGELEVIGADWIFEIHNPFSFRGATFIDKEWADASASNPERIRIQKTKPFSFSSLLAETGGDPAILKNLPEPIALSIATCSTDPNDLIALAQSSCELLYGEDNSPTGLCYTSTPHGHRPVIHNEKVFEAVANNPALPQHYKIAMVLRPGVQGKSEIVGEFTEDQSHIYEYLRRNSYIAGGHYAANMSEDAVRYSIKDLTQQDMKGLRHLYYQRTYARLCDLTGLHYAEGQASIPVESLEAMRLQLKDTLSNKAPSFTATLWGWNFGFDYAPSRYRLHASHQQIHQQYAMLPGTVESYDGDPEKSIGTLDSYGCGDLITQVIDQYAFHYSGSDFFTDYRKAIANNRRMDGNENGPTSLIIWQDDNVMLFVPKAQTSQWELQIMTVPDKNGYLAGNIIETDKKTRDSIDYAIFLAQKALYGRGADMVTSIEFPKRLDNTQNNQPLIYCLLPRLPESPGAFSEAQLRYINGHYPEDFAHVLRNSLQEQNLLK